MIHTKSGLWPVIPVILIMVMSVPGAHSQKAAWKTKEKSHYCMVLTSDTDRVVVNLKDFYGNQFCVNDGETDLYFLKKERSKKTNVYARKIDGSRKYGKVTGLDRDLSDLALSPVHGEYLAFVHTKKGKGTIYAVPTQTGGPEVPLISMKTSCLNPVFLPRSRKMMFTTTEKSKPVLYSFDLNDRTTGKHIEGQGVSFFRDGRQFVFTRKNKKTKKDDLYLYDILSGEEKCLLQSKNTSYFQPQVSPDGKYIAYCASPSSGKKGGSYLDIFYYDILNGHSEQLTHYPGHDLNPQWSADSRAIYFISDRESEKKIYNIWKINVFN